MKLVSTIGAPSLLILAAVFPLGCSQPAAVVPGGRTTTERSSTGVDLSITAGGTDRDPVVTITLQNHGPSPVRVDRELVFLFRLEFLRSDGSNAPLVEEPGTLMTSISPAELASRLVIVPPGGQISRRVEPRKGYRAFIYGWSDKGQITAYEVVVRWDDWAHVERCNAEIGVWHMLGAAMRQYTGSDLQSLGLFSSPLKAQTWIKQGE